MGHGLGGKRVALECYPADWDRHGKAAGPIRNQRMIDTGVDLVVAFHDDLEHSKGTGHMVKIARLHGRPVWHLRHVVDTREVGNP